VRSIDSVLEARELTRQRAACRADLVPTVGAAVGLVMAGSWTASGNKVREPQARGEDAAMTSASVLQDEQRGLMPGILERGPRRYPHPARAISGSIGKPGLRPGTAWSPVPISTRAVTLCRCSPGRGKMTKPSRVLAALGTVVSLEVGHSRTLARPRVGVEPGRKHDRTWPLVCLAPRRRCRSSSVLCDANSRTPTGGGLMRAGYPRASADESGAGSCAASDGEMKKERCHILSRRS